MKTGRAPSTLSDTDPKVRARQLEMLRRLTPERRLEITFDLCQMVRDLAREGVRMRYPNATEAQRKRHFADVILGPELAMKVYGPHEDVEQESEHVHEHVHEHDQNERD